MQKPWLAEIAFREALSVVRTYSAVAQRPALSEVVVNGARGFSLIWLDGGGEVRLGRSHYGEKLARLDQILEALRKSSKDSSQSSHSLLRLVHLDGPSGSRVSLRLDSGNP